MSARDRTARRGRGRVRARRWAVQGLYQWQLSGQKPAQVLQEFLAERDLALVDREYFERLMRGIGANSGALEDDLAPLLDRAFGELDPVERVVLLIGAYELRFCPEVPWRVVINEAVELEKTFGAEEGYRYVNTVLDRLARLLRPQEVTAGGREPRG